MIVKVKVEHEVASHMAISSFGTVVVEFMT